MKFSKLEIVAIKKLKWEGHGYWNGTLTFVECERFIRAGLRPVHIQGAVPGRFVGTQRWFIFPRWSGNTHCRFKAAPKVTQKIQRWKNDIEQAEATRRANYQALAHRRARSAESGGSVG